MRGLHTSAYLSPEPSGGQLSRCLSGAEVVDETQHHRCGRALGHVGTRGGAVGFPTRPLSGDEANSTPAGIAAAGQRAAGNHAVRSMLLKLQHLDVTHLICLLGAAGGWLVTALADGVQVVPLLCVPDRDGRSAVSTVCVQHARDASNLGSD